MVSSAEPTPRIPLTVKVWVAVVVGVTVCMPTGITIIPSRKTLFELVAVQDSVTESPLLIMVRDAVRKAVGVGGDELPPHIRSGMHRTIKSRTDVGRMNTNLTSRMASTSAARDAIIILSLCSYISTARK